MNPFFDSQKKRVRAFWRLLLQAVMFVACSSLLIGLLGPLVARAFHLEVGPDGLSGLAVRHLGFLGFAQVAKCAAALVSVGIAARFLDRHSWRDIGFSRGGKWMLDAALGFLLGALLMTGIFVVELVAGWVTVAEGPVNHTGLHLGLALTLSLVVVIVGAFAEELVFRGYQLPNLAEGVVGRRIGPRRAVLVAVLLSAAFFGAIHAVSPGSSLMAVANIAFAGLLYGLAFVATGRLGFVTGLHAAWNFFQGNLFGFATSGQPPQASVLHTTQAGPPLWTGGSFGPEAGLVSAFAVILGIAVIGWQSRRGFPLETNLR